MSTPYDLPLTADPKLGRLMCESIYEGFGDPSGVVEISTGVVQVGPGPHGAWPQASDPNLTCDPNGGPTYRFKECASNAAGLCAKQETQCETTVWKYQTPKPPVGWPCPVKPL
jgi:hypothetical protein